MLSYHTIFLIQYILIPFTHQCREEGYPPLASNLRPDCRSALYSFGEVYCRIYVRKHVLWLRSCIAIKLISNHISEDIPPQMKFLNKVFPKWKCIFCRNVVLVINICAVKILTSVTTCIYNKILACNLNVWVKLDALHPSQQILQSCQDRSSWLEPDLWNG